MRHGRAKAARKTLKFFHLSVGITTPYQVVLDGTFLAALITQKVPLRDRLDKTLQHQGYSLHVTRSALIELEKLFEASKKEEFQQARQWGLDNADNIIEEAAIPQQDTQQETDILGVAGREILTLIQSKPQYFVCSQDEKLLDVLRSMGTTPLMRLSRGVLLLENPSKSSQIKATSQEKAKWSVGGSFREGEKKLVDHVKQDQRRERQQTQHIEVKRFRAKGKAKGPNPLSCKKKRPASDPSEQTRRTRRKTTKEDA
jgi:U3 small nucleolar RNA-associated protein 23